MSILRALPLVLLVLATAPAADAYPIRLAQVATGLSKPVAVVAAPGRPADLFVIEQHSAKVLRIDRATGTVTTFLDLPDADINNGSEQGLLGIVRSAPATASMCITTDRSLLECHRRRYPLCESWVVIRDGTAANAKHALACACASLCAAVRSGRRSSAGRQH